MARIGEGIVYPKIGEGMEDSGYTRTGEGIEPGYIGEGVEP
jgi:hypothetical protein